MRETGIYKNPPIGAFSLGFVSLVFRRQGDLYRLYRDQESVVSNQ
jgi:hypothetical protein